MSYYTYDDVFRKFIEMNEGDPKFKDLDVESLVMTNECYNDILPYMIEKEFDMVIGTFKSELFGNYDPESLEEWIANMRVEGMDKVRVWSTDCNHYELIASKICIQSIEDIIKNNAAAFSTLVYRTRTRQYPSDEIKNDYDTLVRSMKKIQAKIADMESKYIL